MTVIAFAGPSLTTSDREGWPEIEWRPPAEAGDLLRLRARANDVICLVDGYFDHRPAVRHKEILLLLSRGIVVLGASSIGALRAAEMDSLGMIGVGAIYRAYASGRLTADDEVALVHGPAEWGWKPLSLPLVDCRATLHRAVRARILAPQEAREVMHAARSLHYADRDLPALLAITGLKPERRDSLLEWIGRCGSSQKRLDAIACLEAAKRGGFRTPQRPPMVRTSLVRALAAECGLAPEELN